MKGECMSGVTVATQTAPPPGRRCGWLSPRPQSTAMPAFHRSSVNFCPQSAHAGRCAARSAASCAGRRRASSSRRARAASRRGCRSCPRGSAGRRDRAPERGPGRAEGRGDTDRGDHTRVEAESGFEHLSVTVPVRSVDTPYTAPYCHANFRTLVDISNTRKATALCTPGTARTWPERRGAARHRYRSTSAKGARESAMPGHSNALIGDVRDAEASEHRLEQRAGPA